MCYNLATTGHIPVIIYMNVVPDVVPNNNTQLRLDWSTGKPKQSPIFELERNLMLDENMQ